MTAEQIEKKIKKTCIQYKIENYTINPDRSINVDGDVDLQQMKLAKLPLKFNKVSGNFYCQNNKLSSLVGSPVSVGGDFNCSINHLVSLEDGPLKVKDSYICTNNILLNLVGCTETIGGSLYIGDEVNSTYSGNIDIAVEGNAYLSNNYVLIDYERCVIRDKLPNKFLKNIQHLKIILSYQRYFEIWNDDLSLNHENFQDFLEEIKDGLL
jgi:acetyltransferase-like isoleucine patch superfamily enzyme